MAGDFFWRWDIMFDKIINAHLNGYLGPFYPVPLARINKVFSTMHPDVSDDWMYHQVRLREVGGRGLLPQKDSLMTNDGYRWFTRLDFLIDQPLGREVIILFPWRKSRGKMDRSIAIYDKGLVLIDETIPIIMALLEVFERPILPPKIYI